MYLHQTQKRRTPALPQHLSLWILHSWKQHPKTRQDKTKRQSQDKDNTTDQKTEEAKEGLENSTILLTRCSFFHIFRIISYRMPGLPRMPFFPSIPCCAATCTFKNGKKTKVFTSIQCQCCVIPDANIGCSEGKAAVLNESAESFAKKSEKILPQGHTTVIESPWSCTSNSLLALWRKPPMAGSRNFLLATAREGRARPIEPLTRWGASPTWRWNCCWKENIIVKRRF